MDLRLAGTQNYLTETFKYHDLPRDRRQFSRRMKDNREINREAKMPMKLRTFETLFYSVKPLRSQDYTLVTLVCLELSANTHSRHFEVIVRFSHSFA